MVSPDLLQPAACMGQHGVDLAGVGRQVGLRHHVVAVVAADILQKLLEVAAVAVDGSAELRVRLVLAADFLEGLLALERVKPAREDVAFATAIPVPELDGRFVVDRAGDVDRKRVERLDQMQRRTLAGGCRRGSFPFCVNST